MWSSQADFRVAYLAKNSAPGRRLRRPGEDLAWIHQVGRIESVLDCAHRIHGGGTVLLNQEIHLMHTNTMLTCANAIHVQRALDDTVVQAFCFFEFLGLIRIDQNRNVEIAIPDVAHDRARQCRPPQIFLRFNDTLREPRDRHAYIRGHRPAAGLQLQHCEVSVVPRVPQAVAVFRPRRPLEAFPAILYGDLLHQFRLFLHARVGSVELEEERRRFTKRQIRMTVDRMDGKCIDENAHTAADTASGCG